MKFTERFFEFPIKVYDGESLVRAAKINETIGENDAMEDGDWVRGMAKIAYWDLDKFYYYDNFSTGKTPEEVVEKGFDVISLCHTMYGEFEVLWKRGVFEKKLNAFTENYELQMRSSLERAMASSPSSSQNTIENPKEVVKEG